MCGVWATGVREGQRAYAAALPVFAQAYIRVGAACAKQADV